MNLQAVHRVLKLDMLVHHLLRNLIRLDAVADMLTHKAGWGMHFEHMVPHRPDMRP